MSRLVLMFTLASLTVAGSAAAQSGGMMSDKFMHMSKANMAMMHKCEGMSHDAMMKNSKCMKMMKMHPDMMKNGAMSDGKMEH